MMKRSWQLTHSIAGYSRTVKRPLISPVGSIHFSTGNENKSQVQNRPQWINVLNESIARSPNETGIVYIALDIATISSCFVFVDLIGYVGSADLVLAVGISRFLRYFRLPLDIFVASTLAKTFPTLTYVNISKLWDQRTDEEVMNETKKYLESQNTFVRNFGLMKQRATDAINSYGLAYMLSRRTLVGLSSVAVIFSLIKSGIDVQHLLVTYGISTEEASYSSKVGEAAGKYAVAMCLSGLMFPASLVSLGYISRMIHQLRTR
jgi:hypothetical protein